MVFKTNLVPSDVLGRKVRADEPVSGLGISTWIRIREAIEAGKQQEALELLDYLLPEGKGLHDLYCDWTYCDLDFVARNFGEEYLPEMLRYAQKVIYGTVYQTSGRLPVIELVRRHAEMMRTHRCGPGEVGNFEVWEEKDRWVMAFDPCGSGGRMRRVGELDGLLPRTQPPFNLGKTSRAYPWSWSKAGVPYYCLHCCVWHEIVPIEERGYPIKITEYDEDPEKPCRWLYYKEPELIPEHYYTRIGKEKPVHFRR